MSNNKNDYVRIFNKLFKSILEKIRVEFADNITMISNIDVVMNKIKSPINRIIINIFQDCIIIREDICKYITTNNVKALKSLDYTKLNMNEIFLNWCKIFKECENIYFTDYLISQTSKLIKITNIYKKIKD